jgi:hypothetical protein
MLLPWFSAIIRSLCFDNLKKNKKEWKQLVLKALKTKNYILIGHRNESYGRKRLENPRKSQSLPDRESDLPLSP